MIDDIPDFLRLTTAERQAAWKGRKLTVTKPTKRKAWHLPKTIDATSLALLRQQEREAKARKKARLTALKNK